VPKTSPPATDETEFLATALNAEADAIRRIAANLVDGQGEPWQRALDLLQHCHEQNGHIVVSGMGKSGLVGAKISATFTSLGQPSSVLHPAEAVHGDLGRVRRDDVVILLSNSGETNEVVNLAAILRADEVPTLGISSNEDSSLARLCSVHIHLGNITEACPLRLAPTTSTTAQLAVGDALALALARRLDFQEDDFHKSHPGGLLGTELRSITEVVRFHVDENLPVLPDTLDIHSALREARRIMEGKRRTGALMLVNERGELSGVFTDADLRRLIVDDPGQLSLPIRKVMTASPKHLTVDHLVRDAVRLVREYRVDEIPVVDRDGKPVGLIDVQDLIAMKIVRE